MFSDSIVKDFDVFNQAAANRLTSFVTLVMNKFYLQGRKERLHRSVVRAVSFARHAANHSMFFFTIADTHRVKSFNSIKVSLCLILTIWSGCVQN